MAGVTGASRPHSHLILVGVSFGLALGTHLTVVFIAPVLLWLVRNKRPRHWSLAVLGLVLGVSVFAYLPLRSGFGPASWGTARTWSGFISLISGQIYRGYPFAIPLDAIVPRLLTVLQYLTEVGFVPLLLSGFGLRWAWRQRQSGLYVALMSSMFYIIYATGYRTPDSYVYLLPVFILVAIGAGLGLHDIAAMLSLHWQRLLLGGAILGLTLLGGFRTGQRISLADDMTGEMFWQSVLNQAPLDAVVLTYQDNHTFTLWYAQYVMQKRPDIAIVDTGLTSYPWYINDLKRTYPHLDNANQLADIFQNHGEYTYPLCAIVGSDQEMTWQLNCLTPS